MQRQIIAHIVSLFGSFGLSDKIWTMIVQKETKKIFDVIYFAAKNKDTTQLIELKNAYLGSADKRSTFHTTIVLNGETPMSLLAYEGDEESVNFLLNLDDDVRYQYFLTLQKNLGKSQRAKSFADFTKEQVMNYPMHNCFYEQLLNSDNILVELMNQSDNQMSKYGVLAYRYACLGDSTKVNELIEKIKMQYAISFPNLPEKKYDTEIGYLYSKYGHHQAAAAYLSQYSTNDCRRRVLDGCLESGYVNQFVTHLNSFSLINRLTVLIARSSFNRHVRNINHSSILFPILVSINEPEFRNLVLEEVVVGNKPDIDSFKAKLLQHAEKINYLIKTYHLNFEQGIACSQQIVLTWILQGLQLIKQTKLVEDVFITILSYIAEPKLTADVARDLFMKVYFVANQKFLINDLDQYLSGIYKSNRYHAVRASSLKSACNEIDSHVSLAQLVAEQHGLFAGSVIGNETSKRKHEMPLLHKERDEFHTILEKHHTRLVSC